MNLQLQLKYGAETLSVSKAATCTVQQLKQELEQMTGLFVRNQKLIFKGKVLADALTLDACKLTTGSKVMLLQSEGLPVKVCEGHTAASTYVAGLSLGDCSGVLRVACPAMVERQTQQLSASQKVLLPSMEPEAAKQQWRKRISS